MNITDIILAIETNGHPNGDKFVFETLTTPRLTKKNRTTKAPTDFTVTVKSIFTAKLGVNYQNEVNRILESKGESSDFIAQKPFGKHYVNGSNWLMESDSTPGKFYAALSRFENRVSRIYINGIEATPEQIEDLKTNYFDKPSTNKPIIEWKTYGIDSIVSVVPVK